MKHPPFLFQFNPFTKATCGPSEKLGRHRRNPEKEMQRAENTSSIPNKTIRIFHDKCHKSAIVKDSLFEGSL
jgi:hypothetical protein